MHNLVKIGGYVVLNWVHFNVSVWGYCGGLRVWRRGGVVCPAPDYGKNTLYAAEDRVDRNAGDVTRKKFVTKNVVSWSGL